MTYKLIYWTSNQAKEKIKGSLVLTGPAHQKASYMCSKKHDTQSTHVNSVLQHQVCNAACSLTQVQLWTYPWLALAECDQQSYVAPGRV